MATYSGYRLPDVMAMPARQFALLLKEAVVLRREAVRDAITAASFPWAKASAQRRIIAALRAGEQEVVLSDEEQRAAIEQFRALAAAQGARRRGGR